MLFRSLQNSVIKKLFILDTIELPEERKLDKFITVSVAPIFAEAIAAIFADLPVSKLYD